MVGMTFLKMNGLVFFLAACLLMGLGCSDSGVSGSTAAGQVGDISSSGEDDFDSQTLGGEGKPEGSEGTTVPELDASTIIWDGGFGKPNDSYTETDVEYCKGFEDECTSNQECCSGYCLEGEDGFRCSSLCSENCPEGYECKAVLNSYPDVVTICVPIVKTLCKECVTDSQCNAGQCVEIGGGTYCTEDCSLLDCPENYSCIEGDDGAKRCFPDNGTCDCNPETNGDVRPCATSTDFGICSGFQTCTLEDGWSACDAQSPSTEICNGLDDDCNGVVDEGLPTSQPCQKENEFGVCAGDSFCQGGPGWVCSVPEPAAEVCDFQDNDCDGNVDEDYKNELGKYSALNHCGGCGKDCEGLFPHGAAYCDDTGPVPFCAVSECEPGFYKEGDFQCLPYENNACKPCVADFQCSGGKCVDVGGSAFCAQGCEDALCPNGFLCMPGQDMDGGPKGQVCLPQTGACDCLPGDEGKKRPCSSTNDVGMCLGFETCDPNVGWGFCDALLPSLESCNGIDDDCSGYVDDGLPSFQACENSADVGVCTGEAICLGPQGWVCGAKVPEVELCDYQDNDCDVEVDENYKNDLGKYALQNHCGACNISCDEAIPNASSICDSSGITPICVVDECAEGFYPVNDFICLPLGDNYCKTCAADAQCEGNVCIEIGDGSYCTSSCDSDDQCPGGYTCEDTGGTNHCIPVNGTCDCNLDTVGSKKLCESSNELGVCFGYEECVLESGWGACTALPPEDELCDGVDNDCDGLVDDGLALTQPCASENDAGLCSGTATCSGGLGWVCDASEPELEACDYLDNDCDQSIDEDYKNLAGQYGLLEHCGSCNNSCVGAVPNAEAYCNTDAVTPICQVGTCAEGFYQLNDFICLPEGESDCKPCQDAAQCDGLSCVVISDASYCSSACTGDGDCPDGYGCENLVEGAFCVPSNGTCDCSDASEGAKKLCEANNGLGTCFGYEECVPTTGWSSCSAIPPVTEVCDGVDNDCNGLVDDALVASQACSADNEFGGCDGDAICAGPNGWLCDAAIPAADLCDYLDNDCDGGVDEDFINAQGKYATQEHCGACGNTCVGAIQNGESFCDGSETTPICKVASCDEGYYALNEFICLPEGDTFCKVCQEDSQCDGLSCIGIGEGTYCTSECTDSSECPNGFGCNDTGAGLFCVPSNGTCDCSLETEGAKKLCQADNVIGTCFGFEECVADTGWSDCSALVPADEFCDGVDNDCNGFVDDGFPLTQACSSVNEFGTCEGEEFCLGVQGFVCNAALPEADTCDYLDNDCDGEVDEDFINAEGKYGSETHCGGCNSPCGDNIENSLVEVCDATLASPTCVALECEEGYFPTSPFQCVEIPDINCFPCTSDDDCFGGVCTQLEDGPRCLSACESDDECLFGYGCADGACAPLSGACSCTPETAGTKQPCLSANGIGECLGFQTCDPLVGWSGCDAPIPALESCNGLDDDCNGIPDDGLPSIQNCEVTNEVGICTGEAVCQGGAGWICDAAVPSEEVCDFLDNDCDGDADEDFKGASGKYDTAEHCGTCGKECGATIANATTEICDGSKVVPLCVATECAPGYFLQSELQCVQIPAISCSPCLDDSSCFGATCVELPEGSFCLETCINGAECGEGYACDGDGICQPENGTCDCTESSDGAQRACQQTNDIGTCLGFETCDAGQGWIGCTASEASVEDCDGVDNDCNGLVDDGLPSQQVCAKKNGFGECPGFAKCYGAAGWVCLADTPEAEVCDFQDNNCDGNIDEDFVNEVGKYASAEHCGTCNNPCGEVFPNSLVELCDDGGGVPQCIVDTCEDGFLKLTEFQCIEIPDVACAPCGSDANCFGASCSELDGGSFCLVECDEGSCSDGYFCSGNQCIPTTGTCTCSPESAGAKRSCFEENNVGLCYGFEECDPVTGWGACDAIPAQGELCNGLDDDCNGFVDDGLPASQDCEATNGFGTCEGSAACYGTLGWFCQSPQPAGEACDYVDNDCDGLTDEDFKTEAGVYGLEEHCGECNKGCEGSILNGDAFCDVSASIPQCIVEGCVDGWEKFNDYLCIPVTSTLCEPCVTDEQCLVEGAMCLALNDGNFCSVPCSEGEDCPSGYTCQGVEGGVTNQCVPNTAACTCDGTNLDLQLSCEISYEQPGTGATTTCFGTTYCAVDGWSGCELPTEICNYLDDNCDGTADETFKNGAGEYAFDEHCGQCNANCSTLSFENGFGSCDITGGSPECELVCEPGFLDVNLNPADGCECAFVSSVDLPDGIDTNCDGVDGEIDVAYFVSKDGSNLNTGAVDDPFLTVDFALEQAFLDGKRDVYVATGVYSENITLRQGISLYGGYNADFTVHNTLIYETAFLGQSPNDAFTPGVIRGDGITGGAELTRVDGFLVFGYDAAALGESVYAVYLNNCNDNVVFTNNRIVAGNASSGWNGSPGTDGINGVDGLGGPPGQDVGNCSFGSQMTNGGSGGSLSCVSTDVSGGNGGDGFCPNYQVAQQEALESGSPGKSGGGAGGEVGYDRLISASGGGGGGGTGTCQGNCGGSAGSCWCDNSCQQLGDCCSDYVSVCLNGGGDSCWLGAGSCGLCLVAADGKTDVGQPGQNGQSGVSGAAGQGCTQAAGSVVNGLWVPGVGVNGGTGADGRGGGGGGAGGGVETCSCGGDDVGGGGGGGGSAGCAGTQGSGAVGGGGSFGLFIHYTAVPSSTPVFTDNVVQRGFGGLGGSGGNGGVGGLPGLGGAGGADASGDTDAWCSQPGGPGGSGGSGGHGGGGGGGCGGASFGMYVAGSGGVALAPLGAQNTFPAGGAGGQGGPGGLSLGNSGLSGSTGLYSETNF